MYCLFVLVICVFDFSFLPPSWLKCECVISIIQVWAEVLFPLFLCLFTNLNGPLFRPSATSSSWFKGTSSSDVNLSARELVFLRRFFAFLVGVAPPCEFIPSWCSSLPEYSRSSLSVVGEDAVPELERCSAFSCGDRDGDDGAGDDGGLGDDFFSLGRCFLYFSGRSMDWRGNQPFNSALAVPTNTSINKKSYIYQPLQCMYVYVSIRKKQQHTNKKWKCNGKVYNIRIHEALLKTDKWSRNTS